MRLKELIRFLQTLENDYGDYQIGIKGDFVTSLDYISTFPEDIYIYGKNLVGERTFNKDMEWSKSNSFKNTDKVIIFE